MEDSRFRWKVTCCLEGLLLPLDSMIELLEAIAATLYMYR